MQTKGPGLGGEQDKRTGAAVARARETGRGGSAATGRGRAQLAVRAGLLRGARRGQPFLGLLVLGTLLFLFVGGVTAFAVHVIILPGLSVTSSSSWVIVR